MKKIITYSGPGVSIHFPVFVIDGDSTAINADSVKSITHITKEGYFAINEILNALESIAKIRV